ncbi:MAG: SUMF1/EgtB/PvdO family nonheme iron enzyme [Candidatus Poribacteria bacterium]|nr:SUMF1/EgtB/PvdO family nonheme iron enzyme [Candidatus Poribacteria bacterium]
MKIAFKVLAFVIVGILAVYMVGCSERAEDGDVEVAQLLRANPTPGSTIEANSTINVTFDKDPGSVTVNLGAVTASGTTVTITGPFPQGQFTLKLTWDGDTRNLTYTVGTSEPPDAEPEQIREPEPVAPDGMVLIPEGEFQMGSEDGDADNDEQPEHTVHIDAFYIDENEITNSQFKDFILANPEWQKNRIEERFQNGNYLHDWNGNNYPDEEGDHPVRYVSWYAAIAYAQWVDKRLPTEAEWEKAARGGLKGKKYPWGNNINGTRANYGKNIGHTTPVGKYLPNDYGVYDMAGNVWEWCLDAYESDFYANSPKRNPVAGADNVDEIVNDFENVVTDRVLRGSGWNGNPEWLRAANRYGDSPAYAGIGALGFRCAKDVE